MVTKRSFLRSQVRTGTVLHVITQKSRCLSSYSHVIENMQALRSPQQEDTRKRWLTGSTSCKGYTHTSLARTNIVKEGWEACMGSRQALTISDTNVNFCNYTSSSYLRFSNATVLLTIKEQYVWGDRGVALFQSQHLLLLEYIQFPSNLVRQFLVNVYSFRIIWVGLKTGMG